MEQWGSQSLSVIFVCDGHGRWLFSQFDTMARKESENKRTRETNNQVKAGSQKVISSYFKKPRLDSESTPTTSASSGPLPDVVEIEEEEEPIDPLEALVNNFPCDNLSQENRLRVQKNVRDLLEITHRKLSLAIEKFNAKKKKKVKISTSFLI